MMEERQGKDSHYYGSAEKGLPADQKSLPPSIFWSIMVEIGFLGWIGSVIAFITFVLRKKAEPVSHVFSASIWIGLIVVFFALWVVGMMRA